MVDTPSPDAIARDAADRIAEADRQADEASYAFAAGAFAEYWARQFEAATKRVQDEYRRLSGQDAEGGGGEAGS